MSFSDIFQVFLQPWGLHGEGKCLVLVAFSCSQNFTAGLAQHLHICLMHRFWSSYRLLKIGSAGPAFTLPLTRFLESLLDRHHTCCSEPSDHSRLSCCIWVRKPSLLPGVLTCNCFWLIQSKYSLMAKLEHVRGLMRTFLVGKKIRLLPPCACKYKKGHIG